MAENLRPAVPPPASDLAGTEGCGSAVTRGSSDLSASTVDGSKACLRSNGDARSEEKMRGLTQRSGVVVLCLVERRFFISWVENNEKQEN
ncbi:hypothetical protein CK203_020525 [Vitis vinifera]|uniref:Uncharacterized protein n=1 Tax=Vitis vinifera TaxID=29760 RepID=A0A438FN18_VITVI|nr:hypothetical protein CK203_069927 [Vitis vinifera]RVW61342.1 hypothetical protein CK203_020525 [Vitis vinifera]